MEGYSKIKMGKRDYEFTSCLLLCIKVVCESPELVSWHVHPCHYNTREMHTLENLSCVVRLFEQT